MGFKSLNIGISYDSSDNQILEEFYIPILENSVSYDRIAGFFSSTSLAIAARGIGGLIRNNGKMRLIASPRLSKEDAELITSYTEDYEAFLSKHLNENIMNIEDECIRDHVYTLGWLIANEKLEIKIAIVRVNNRVLSESELVESGLFHQKVGILKDAQGDVITFSGSVNETASGWLHNIEEFKTFKSWEDGQVEYCNKDVEKFDSYWNNKKLNVNVIDLPTAVKENLIKNALDNPLDFLNSELVKSLKNSELKKSNSINLFVYQREAFELWKKNDMIILLEMATGTGKTRTAIACIKYFISIKKKPVVIVACPQGTLSRQWKNEVESLNTQIDKSIIIDGTNNKWATDLSTSLLEVKIGRVKSLVVYTTHITACKIKFVNEISKWDEILDYLLVGDEVHGMGASETKKSLLLVYKSRLGLSATPQRWFDEEGTKIIENYFNNVKFEFGIYDALTNINPLTGKSFLVDYYYHPVFISLIDEEIEKYMLLSNRISKLSNMNSKSDDYSATLEKLIFDRANIQKNAYNKYSKLSEILDNIKSIKDMIIFVSPEQIEDVMYILRDKNIIAHK